MATKIKVKLIIELASAGLSRNKIALSRNMGKNSVGDVLRIAKEKGLTAELIKDFSDDEVYQLIFPQKYQVEHLYEKPDYDYVHSELKKTGVTLKLLWNEYKDICLKKNSVAVGYTKYCTDYSTFTISNKLTKNFIHKIGEAIQVDWSGKTMAIVNRTTGELIKAYLFVATLPYSQYSYVEACLNMKQETWLKCHIHMWEFFGGATTRTICDNLKTGVLSHPREGDIILNDEYEALGMHYTTAIMPTGVRKPKMKAAVEGVVGKIATAIIAKLRNESFSSLYELNIAIAVKLKNFNDEPFQKREGSRTLVFKEEKEFLIPLPAVPYEISTWVYARSINLNSHVAYKKNYYSCPYQYIGKKVDLKIGEKSLEIYLNHDRIGTHLLFSEYMSNKYSTHTEDMPDHFKKLEWDDERIKNWAISIGNSTGEVINRIFSSVLIKEQAYNPSLSVLRLSKNYSKSRLEIACEFALTKIRSPRYSHLKAILSSNQDQVYISNNLVGHSSPKTTGYVRGASYYGGENND